MTRSDDSGSAPIIGRKACVLAFDGRVVREGEHPVVVERPVQITFADVPFAVMMLTPSDLIDFAYGFSLTEGVIGSAADIRGIELQEIEDGQRLRISLAGDSLHKHLARRRAMTGRTGCGVCGIDDIEALRRAEQGHATARPIALAAVERALGDLGARQVLNQATRAVHAAAFADAAGTILEVREDVGRHNALDKLIGAMIRSGRSAADGFVLVTSRCSFEMVEKTAVFGATAIVAISAPTSFAIDRAAALGVALIAIARHDTVTVFEGAERMVLPAGQSIFISS